MTLAFIFNQYDIEPGDSYLGEASSRRNRTTLAIVRVEASKPKGSRIMFHVERFKVAGTRGRERFEIKWVKNAQTRGIRQRLTISRLSVASAGRMRCKFELGLIGRASLRKALLRGVRA